MKTNNPFVAIAIMLGAIAGLVLVAGLVYYFVFADPWTAKMDEATPAPEAPAVESTEPAATKTTQVGGFIISGDYESAEAVFASDGSPAGIIVRTETGWVGANYGPDPVTWIWTNEGIECKTQDNVLVCTYEEGRFEVHYEGGL